MAKMPLHKEIEQRFGVLPNFFQLASDTPEVTVNLWGFARFAYLDSPLPSLFKERLFVYLSRFCEVRYCIARHVGFLVGLGYPAGDRDCPPQTIEQVLPLLQRPLPRGKELEPTIAFCATYDSSGFEFPSPDTALESAIFACATHVFLQTPDALRAMVALRQMFGTARLELLNVFLAYVRMAHYWTQIHPELRFEDDINYLLVTHQTLAVCLLNDPEVKDNALSQQVLEELASLQQLKVEHESLVQVYEAVSRENEQLPIAVQERQQIQENLRQLVNINTAAVYTCQADGTILYYNQQAVELWGWEPNQRDRQWTPGEAWRVYLPDGTLLRPEQLPMQQVFATGVAIVNRELVIERSDQTRIHILVNINLIRNAAGVVSAAVNVFQDISDRVRLEGEQKRAEVALQASESRLRLALKIGKLGSWQLDLKTNELLTSAQCKANYGLSPDADFSHQVLFSRIHPDDRAWVEAAIQQAIEQHSEYDVEYRNVWDDGSIHWALVRGCTFYDSDGTPLQILGMSLDITERKLAEAAARKADERFRNMADSASVLMWQTDETGIVYVNRHYLKFFAETLNGVKGMGWANFLHPEDAAAYVSAYRSAFERQQRYEFQCRFRRHDGEYRWLQNVGEPHYGLDHTFVGFIGCSVDVTDIKMAQAELQASEERFRNMADNAPMMTWVTDATGYCTYLSRSWYDFSGQTETTGLGFGWLDATHRDDRESAKAIFLAANERHIAFQLEYRLRRQDGQYRTCIDTAKPWFGADGIFKGYIGSVIDITYRQQAEEVLRESEARLAAEASALVRLNEASSRLWRRLSLSEGLNEMLAATIELLGADMGNIQLLDADGGMLRIAAQQGFKQDFLDFFREVSTQAESSCGRTLRSGKRTIIEDIEVDAPYAPLRSVAHAAGYRAVQSTPLLGRDGAPLGMLSTHWRSVHRPSEQDLRRLDLYVRQAVDFIENIRAEAALRQSEERYRTLFESIDEGFCIVEMLFDDNDRPLDYRFLEINPVFEQQTGLQQAVGKTARQLVPDLEDHWVEIYGKVAKTGESVRFENGSAPMNRWFDVYACRTGQPSERKVAIVFKDISEQQAALRERKLSEAILQRTAALNTLRVSFADALRPLADPVEIQATASRVLGEYLGANRVAYFEVRGADYVVERDYVNGVDALAGNYPIDSFGAKLLAAYRTGRAVSASDVATDPNLSPEQRSAYAAIQIGAYIGIPLLKQGVFVAGLAVHTADAQDWMPDEVALAEEVAERTWAAVERARAEAALRDSENRFRTAIESAQLGTWDWNLITNQLIWDQGCKAMFGLPPAAQISIEVFFAGLHPDDRDRVERVMQVALNPASGGKFDVEYRTIGLQDKVERWISARGQAYFDAAGNPQRFVGTVLNITEQKRIEAEREQLLTREQAAREAADRANRVKDEFLAVLSHELRSPLNPILGWSKLLQQGKLDTTRTKTALATIERNAQLQAQLIDDLLDISRILRGKMSLNEMPVDLRMVISSALETVHLAAQAKALHIQTHISPDVGAVMGDAGRLQQVVWNLLSNAVKFTPPAGQVTVTLIQTGTDAQIQVTDTGKGIKLDFLPYVFEHFRQEDGATTRKFGGLGLGLAIARQIVELHGGTIAVASPGEGQGATFTVQLPLASVSSQTLPSAFDSVSTDGDLSDTHILVVDDEPDSREFVAFVLEQAGAIVTKVASGIEALQTIDRYVFELIVSDIGMPEMDGYMLMQQIRARSPASLVPAIALTAYAGEFDRQQALAAGFQRHLAKPIEPEMLVQTIVSLINVSSTDIGRFR